MKAVNPIGVLVTRPDPLAAALIAQLTKENFQVWHLPTLTIHSLADTPDVKKILIHFMDYSWHVFVSRNAVHAVLPALKRSGYDLNSLHWAAVGSGTAAELASVIKTDIIYPHPDIGSEALLLTLDNKMTIKDRVLIWCGDEATPTLAEGLQARGITVQSVVCYQREKNALDITPIKSACAAGQIHYVLVSSGASLTHLVALLTVTLLNSCTLVVVSGRLEKLARSLGFTGKIILAQGADDAAMVKAIKG